MSEIPQSHPDQGELRTDFLGRMVVLTPGRAGRPHDFAPTMPVKKTPPADCYFCPGNESKTPPEIARVDDPAQKGAWLCRSFPNKFPAFSGAWPKAHGLHEVVVETPRHEQTLSQLSDSQLSQYLGLVVRRLRAHARERKSKVTFVFKNEWEGAGASLEHTHTQLVALPEVPPAIKQMEKACKTNCPFCLLSIDDRYPKIVPDGQFLWLTPFAPRFNYESWIVPRNHVASMTDLDENSLSDLARVLGKALRAQDACLNYAPYNILFYLAPYKQKNFHFHIELAPRIAKWAGFEMGSGVVMNSVRPEFAAEELRKQIQ